jgi:hypothetical protein
MTPDDAAPNAVTANATVASRVPAGSVLPFAGVEPV